MALLAAGLSGVTRASANGLVAEALSTWLAEGTPLAS